MICRKKIDRRRTDEHPENSQRTEHKYSPERGIEARQQRGNCHAECDERQKSRPPNRNQRRRSRSETQPDDCAEEKNWNPKGPY